MKLVLEKLIDNLYFPKFQEKRTISQGVPNFSEVSYRVFAFQLNFFPEFLEFSIEWFIFRKFDNFRLFRKRSKEISDQGKMMISRDLPKQRHIKKN